MGKVDKQLDAFARRQLARSRRRLASVEERAERCAREMAHLEESKVELEAEVAGWAAECGERA